MNDNNSEYLEGIKVEIVKNRDLTPTLPPYFNDKLTFYERCRASLGELRNHFKEALSNKYIDEDCYESFFRKMNEIGYLLNRMMEGMRTARDLHESERKSKYCSSRRLTSNPQ